MRTQAAGVQICSFNFVMRTTTLLNRRMQIGLLALLASVLNLRATTDESSSLRLVPFPKQIERAQGSFSLKSQLVLEVNRDQAEMLRGQLADELKLAGFKAPTLLVLKQPANTLRLSSKPRGKIAPPAFRADATAEDYVLQIQPDAITVAAPGPEGLAHGGQTLRQLIRANRTGDALPCVTIRDWPSIRWRAFQDDLTRGPSSTLENLKLQAALGTFLKQNILTYYMEYQFAFAKHPAIGPKDGSLTPEELKALVKFSVPLHLNILGNQQSFGHFTAILAHPEYAALRETPHLLCPTNEVTYRLLNDLYSEVAPLLPFPFFNVCCDETEGLGTGPSKPLADQIGVGALYLQHIRRVHDLVHKKYGKRMMMWGDIILQHPDKLNNVPKDIVMLTWGYDPRPNFEGQITPFAKSGHDFFVCPGVNNWSRVLPNFGAATTNIRNFVRDGAKHGAIGVLNTAWDDDGENFNAPNWHGIAWGAECAWNASATAPENFNRRLGAVLFGEKGDHFGQAIAAVTASGLDGMFNPQFWKIEFTPLKIASVAAERERLEKQLVPLREAIRHFEACQREAIVNADLPDFFLFGARRLELSVQRELDRLGAAVAYRDASGSATDSITKAAAVLRQARDAHEALGRRFAELWRRENKPYALDWTQARYRDALDKYDAVLAKLASAREAARAGRALPAAKEVGLELVETEIPQAPATSSVVKPVVEVEEDVYSFEPANNGAGPLWCAGSTCLVRIGERVFASGIETLKDCKPLNNCRWTLFKRGPSGWELLRADETGRTREPSPLVAFPDGRLFLSANPTLVTNRETYSGPARPEILHFAAKQPKDSPERILPVWEGEPQFTEHSYRSFAADGPNREFFLFQNIGHTHAEWAVRDRDGQWKQGRLRWPEGKDYPKPEPIRICYPNVMLKNRAVYFCGVSDIVEPYPEWRAFKKQLTGQAWDYDFRRLFFTWCSDIKNGTFHEWIELASRDKTCGWISPGDLWVGPDGEVHLLWAERVLDERLRQKFFPDAKQSHAINYALVRDGKVAVRRTLCVAEEGRSQEYPSAPRFHATPDNRLFVIYYVYGTDAAGKRVSENRLMEIRSNGELGESVRLGFKLPFTSYFTATVRAGSAPSDTLDLLGHREGASQTISYARVRLR